MAVNGQVVIRPEWELYDLQADPLETRDVLSENLAVAAGLQAELSAWEGRVAARQVSAVEGGWGDPRLSLVVGGVP